MGKFSTLVEMMKKHFHLFRSMLVGESCYKIDRTFILTKRKVGCQSRSHHAVGVETEPGAPEPVLKPVGVENSKCD
ncbi:hypothetical protein CK203_009353 [Vitis vinifera]|uniref:Uncharacterized protein n=1 Tax=Vitis vinifera TaxID=29760 RepID=A0A438JSI3_VITVI|nr:hypothetical protein CK203_009353 [Vitis vinifera]